MINYWRFIKHNKVLLLFGVMMTFFSGFGQTFLIGVYVPFLLDSFPINNGHISLFYGIATLGSAFLLPAVGKMIDQVNVKYYTLGATFLFVLALVSLSLIDHWWLIPFAFFGLRFSGQGLFSHISITAMSKYFDKGRGKAISLASLGHSLGGAILPMIMLYAITAVGWRGSLLASALVLILVVPLYLFIFLRQDLLKDRESSEIEQLKESEGGGVVRQRDLLKSKSFWLITPNIFILSFTVTALFFYQFAIAEDKGWNMEWMAASLSCYAISSSCAIIFSGPLIDRYKASVFFPFYLLPFLAGLIVLATIEAQWVAPVYLAFMGISSGFGGAIVSNLQVEFFGSKSIGTVRSLFTSIMVLSTAAGPAFFGLFLDAGYSFSMLIYLALLLMALVFLLGLRAQPLSFYKELKKVILQKLRFIN